MDRRKKLFLWITIMGILIAVPVAWMVLRWTRSSLLNALDHRALDELKVHMAHMQSEVDHRYTITRIVAADERVREFMHRPSPPEDRVRINRYLKRFEDAAGSVAYLLDLEGRVVASGNWDKPDSFLDHDFGFRPNIQASLKGEEAQYVAVGVTATHLGLDISTPIRVGERIVGVAATMTNPQDLIMSHEKHSRPLIVTDADGVAIIGSSSRFLYHSVTQGADGSSWRISRFGDRKITPMTSQPLEKAGDLWLIHLSEGHTKDGQADVREYLLVEAPFSKADWKAFILWPTDDLDTPLTQRRLITGMALILAWLLCLYTVERWQHMKQMEDHALRDPLTQVYTRLYMLESATAMLAAHDRNSISGVSAIMFDLDWFKNINDQFGHSAGDNVLVQVSGVINKECRESDIPIRYGGEEFLVFVPSGDQEQVLQLAERIRLQIRNLEITLAGKSIQLTISGGIAAHMPGEPLEKLIDRADRMMYQAKQNGRDQIMTGDITV